MNDYLKKKIQFKVIDYRSQIAKDRLHGMPISLILINKDNLTKVEFREFILAIEDALDDLYEVKRMPILSEYCYILKVSAKVKKEPVKYDGDNINALDYY